MLKFMSKQPSWVKCIIIELILIIFVGLIIIFVHLKPNNDAETTNPMNNEISIMEDVVEAKLKFKSMQNYENIETYRFIFVDNNDQEINFNDCKVNLNDIIDTVDSILNTIKYEVCSIGIVGKELYLQVDTREECNNQKCNITTIKDGMLIDDWIELLELINNTNKVNADSLIRHNTELGNTHYIYIYENTNENNIADNSNILSIEDLNSNDNLES